MKRFFSLFLFIALAACSQQGLHQPLSTPTPEDTYWNGIAEKARPSQSFLNTVRENNPGLYLQIATDAGDPLLPVFWGKSLNFDSAARTEIVDKKIIADLQEKFGIKNDNVTVHAGVMHTYGYLFSTIDTPYGYKRKRWIAPTLNYAFNFGRNSLSPDTVDGGMLSNITYFMGMLAFKDTQNLGLLKNVSNEVFTYDYQKVPVERVEESSTDYTLVTTFVPLLFKRSHEENDFLLIYTLVDQRLKKEFLLTGFPITQKAYEALVHPSLMGENKKITVKYNAVVEELGTSFTGTRVYIKGHNRQQ